MTSPRMRVAHIVSEVSVCLNTQRLEGHVRVTIVGLEQGDIIAEPKERLR